MAKKARVTRSVASSKPAEKVKLTPRDEKTMSSLVGLADGVVKAAAARRDPYVDIPSRTLTNVRYSARKRIIEMGSGKNRRQLFDLSQAKAYMRTMLVASGCKRLLDQGKSTSLRGLFYMLKHTLEGTKENTFDEQGECDTIIEDVEVLLSSIREELHLYAENRGAMVGNITFTDRGDEINCARMGSGGYAIPSICEPDVIVLDKKRCKADFILHVEKARSGSDSTKTASGKSTIAFSRMAAASPRVACDGCCTGCTTSWGCRSTACSIMTPGGTTSTA